MRRRSKSKIGFALTKTTGDIARNRGFQKPSELSKTKRVRFDDAERDASSGGHETVQYPKCGAPKTSEYAYFRKVKEGAVNGQFHALHKENEQLKSSKSSYLHRELTHKTKQRSSLLTETATPVGQSLFSSRLNQASENFGLPCPENQCTEKGILSEKRKRLRQWVAHTTSSEVGNLHENGSDLVSLLLSRLIPKGNGNNDSSKENADKTIKSLTAYESDNVEKGLPLSHKSDCHKEIPKVSSERSSEIVLREWDGFDSGFTSNCREEGDLQETMDRCGRSSEIVLREWDSFDSGFPSNYRKEGDLQKTMDRCGRSSEMVLREWDSFESGFPSNYPKESDLENKTMDPDQHSNSRICNSSDTQHGYSFSLPFESFRSLSTFHFKDLDEFGPIVGHGREEPYSNSLEWDFGLEKDRVDHGTRQGIEDKVLDTKGFFPSTMFSSRCLFNPLPNNVSTGCFMHEVQPKFNDVKHGMVKPGQLAVSFPCSPKCIPLAEDKNAEKFLPNSNILLSYRDPRWPKKVWDCMHHSNFWWNCSSGPEYSAEDNPSGFHAWQFPQNENGSYSFSVLKESRGKSVTSFPEGAFDHYLFSSTLHSPLDTFMNCPLLLNHVSQDIHDQELYSDDYEKWDTELGSRCM